MTGVQTCALPIFTIQKLVTGTKDKPLAGVEFLITDSSGAYVGPNKDIYKTDEYGRIVLSDLKPGTVITAKETATVDGFVLDGTPKSIEIKEGEAQTLTFYNTPVGGLELIKVSESDKSQRIKGVTFEIREMDGGLVDTITTGDTGRISKVTPLMRWDLSDSETLISSRPPTGVL